MNDEGSQSLKKLIEVLYGVLFFNIFSEEELCTVLRESSLIKWKKFGKGTKVFSEGSYDGHFYAVIHGEIHIIHGSAGKQKDSRKDSRVGKIGKGGVFGEMVVCDPEKPRRASAYVSDEEDAILCEVDAALIDTVPEHIKVKFCKKVLDLILGRFKDNGPKFNYYEAIVKYLEENEISSRDDFFTYAVETAISEQNRLTQFIKYTDFLVAKKLDPGKGHELLRDLISRAKDELDQSLRYST